MSKPALNPFIFKTILILFLTLLIPFAISGDEKKKNDFWLPMEERIKTWDAIAGKGNYTISANRIEANYEKDGAKWTIIGANAPIVNPTVYPKDWPVKGEDFEVLVILEPITNYKILPFTEKIENAVKSDTISITAAKDSYEPASFVILSGDVDLKNVMIEITDLKAKVKGQDGKIKTAIIPKEQIDIRVVKCWYQAGKEINDVRHKLLTPELLLHDDDVVRVDYERQVNIIRNLAKVEDAMTLRSFSIPKNQNKQIWLTAHVVEKIEAGTYSGDILIKGNAKKTKLKIKVNVLPFVLPQPMLEYSLYYEGRLSDSDVPVIEAGMKTEKQMKAELEDMKAHGLTNATVWHRVNEDKTKWGDDWKRLQKTIDIRKEIGWSDKPLFYLDWRVSFKNDVTSYKEKILKIIEIAKKNGVNDIYIYGVDEKIGGELEELNNSLYKDIHTYGAKNFVAGWIDHFLRYSDNIDLIVVSAISRSLSPDTKEKISRIKRLNKLVMSYNSPQAGVEAPDTYRNNYGINLIKVGADGAMNYAYQTGFCWNDFVSQTFRPHVMAYPTIEKPIPTIQWEGWSQGANDVRFLSLLKQRNMLGESWIKENCSDSKGCRDRAIHKLLR